MLLPDLISNQFPTIKNPQLRVFYRVLTYGLLANWRVPGGVFVKKYRRCVNCQQILEYLRLRFLSK